MDDEAGPALILVPFESLEVWSVELIVLLARKSAD